MGLDMYLDKKVRGYKKDDGTISFNHSDLKENEFGIFNLTTVEENVAYWRKANCIHRWFVEHCGDNVDDCHPVTVTIADIKSLLSTCNELLKTLDGTEMFHYSGNGDVKARVIDGVFHYTDDLVELEELFDSVCLWNEHFVNHAFTEKANAELPTVDGFFFGDTSYDGAYVYDLVVTILMLSDILLDYNKILDACEDEDARSMVKSHITFDYQASW